VTLLHFWPLAIGAAAVGLPVTIHLLTRPRPRRMELSTVRFVRELLQQRRARSRLRDWIILALRTLAVALIAIAFARPLLGTAPLVAPDNGGRAVRIVMLDQSQSMAARSGGSSAFDRARAIAARYLNFGTDMRGNLILAGAQPRATFDRLSTNVAAMRQDLSTVTARSERLNLQAAINAASEMLATQSGDDPSLRRELVIVSDFQRSNWSSVDFSPLPKETLIQLESVAPPQAPANLAVLRVGAQGRLEQGRSVRLEVEVGNYSTAPRDVQVELTVGEAQYHVNGVCAPGGKTTLTGDVTLRDAGWKIGRARLVGVDDALPNDDARWFVLDVRPAPTYALVTRDPSKPQPSSSHFLERALVPATNARAGERVVRVDPQKLDRDAVASADLIILDHPGRLGDERCDLIAALMRRGRAVLYVASEPADAVNLKRIADASGSDLKMPVEFQPPPSGQPRRNLFLAEFKRDQPPFNSFGESAGAALGPLRFGGGLATHRLEAGLADDVLASYSDRSAALVVTSCGAGALAVLNADLNASNVPASPAFVPMLGELVGRLIGQRRLADASPSGEALAMYLPIEAGPAQGLSISPAAPDAPNDSCGTLLEEGGFVAWHWSAVAAPGAYVVKRGDSVVFALASAAPALESDLATMDPVVLKDRLSGGRKLAYSGGGSDSERRKDDTWSWIIVACAACMMGELTALKLFKT
jgi:hypothetical protein